MPLNISNTDAFFNAKIQKLKSSLRRGLEAEMPKIKEQIVQKAKSGIQFDGTQMPAYSLGYEQYKRNVLGQSGQPNATLTGDMLASLRVVVGQFGENGFIGSVEVTGSFNRNKARWTQGANSSIPPRKFMGIDDSTSRQIRNNVLSLLEI